MIRPTTTAMLDDGGPRRDLVVATKHDVDPARVIELIASLSSSIDAAPLVSSHPIYWTRLQSSSAVDRSEVMARLEQGGIRVRYVACARSGSQKLAPPLHLTDACPRRARGWKARATAKHRSPHEEHRFMLGARSIHAEHDACGTGAGTRLAVIDDDSIAPESLTLDAETAIFGATPQHASQHAALLVGCAVGTRDHAGMAPDASPRVYVIPKPGQDVVSLPVAIVRAVDDGADVVVCATFIDDVAGPLLDDALELAASLGRGGRGTLVLFPASGELSHASLSLGAPASHPYAFCIGPSTAEDAVESGAVAGVAAGVALLVLARNPELTRSELAQILAVTAGPTSQIARETRAGHLVARRACLTAADPITATLVRIGEDAAADSFAVLRGADPDVQQAYSSELARWAARALLMDSSLSHALAALLRHVRLICCDPARAGSHPEGALLRHAALVLRMASGRNCAPKPSETVAAELGRGVRTLVEHSAEPRGAHTWEAALYAKLSRLWPGPSASHASRAAE